MIDVSQQPWRFVARMPGPARLQSDGIPLCELRRPCISGWDILKRADRGSVLLRLERARLVSVQPNVSKAPRHPNSGRTGIVVLRDPNEGVPLHPISIPRGLEERALPPPTRREKS